jgi:hypothetical protein
MVGRYAAGSGGSGARLRRSQRTPGAATAVLRIETQSSQVWQTRPGRARIVGGVDVDDLHTLTSQAAGGHEQCRRAILAFEMCSLGLEVGAAVGTIVGGRVPVQSVSECFLELEDVVFCEGMEDAVNISIAQHSKRWHLALSLLRSIFLGRYFLSGCER